VSSRADRPTPEARCRQLPSATASDLKTVVVGGSLSGLMVALGLARAGAAVTVLERTGPQPRSGAALGNAESNLHRILGPGGLAGPDVSAALSGTSPRLQTWEEAHRLLTSAAAAEPRIELSHGVMVVEVGKDERSPWVRTDDGSLLRADLLVGADGHRSVVRRHVAPDRPDASFAGYVIWLGIALESELDLPAGSWVGVQCEGPPHLQEGSYEAEEGEVDGQED
jgi:2-polyprenyl-6-methoxyphenol hydroxylase-like FAD-dependent oxidoreductase